MSEPAAVSARLLSEEAAMKLHRGRCFTKKAYFDRVFNAHAVKILPGQYHACADHAIITTVLGSCVSVCLYDTAAGIGGMNHFMLPGDTGGKNGSLEGSARYGIHAMELLLEHVLSLGADRYRLQAKVFGAGRVMDGLTDVGKRNSEFALRYLEEKRIPVQALDVGSDLPRKVYFFAGSGQVFVKRIRKQELSRELFLALARKKDGSISRPLQQEPQKDSHGH
jgi:chemotaxis protein CheD